MRLTLRTLLAYLDDILEPSQTKEIGAKLTESKFATSLVDRIRDVIRRRRLTAPEIHGKGANDDPNVVSEYLDNTLAPDKVAEFERVCLESDVQLAEAAACHQILTLVLGEPVEIRNESRRRMYTLVGEHQAAEAAAKAKKDGASVNTEGEALEEEPAVASGTTGSTDEEHESFNKQIPDYLRPRPFWQRALAPVLIFTVLGLAVVLAITDADFRAMLGGFVSRNEPDTTIAQSEPGGKPEPQKPQLTDQPKQPQPAPVTSTNAGEPLTKPELDKKPNSAAPVSVTDNSRPSPESIAKTDNQPDSTKPEIPVSPEPLQPELTSTEPSATPAVPQSSAHEDQATHPAGPRGAVIASLPGKAAAPARTPPTPPQPMAEESPTVLPLHVRDISSEQSVLVRFDTKKDGWYVVSQKAADPATARKIFPNDLIACPEPFESSLDVGEGTCRLLLRGGTAIRLLGPTAAGPFGLEVRKGRVVVAIGTSVDDNALKQKPIQFGVVVRGELRRVELTKPGTVCGIEVIPGQPEKLDQDLATVGYDAKLHLGAGALGLIDKSGKRQELSNSGWLSLSPQTMSPDPEVSTEQVSRALAEFTKGGSKGPSGVNRWLHTQPLPLTSINARKFATQFLREFDEDQPLRLSIAPVVRDGNPLISELAVKTLALIEDYTSLLKALAEGSHEEALNAAIEGLRDWLPLSPDNPGLLKAELANVFRPDVAEVIYRLLWGYGKADAEDRDISLQLVNWLEHDELAVRQLAFYHIQRLTGQKHRYQADLAPTQRTTIVGRLRTSVEKTGGLLRKSNSKSPN